MLKESGPEMKLKTAKHWAKQLQDMIFRWLLWSIFASILPQYGRALAGIQIGPASAQDLKVARKVLIKSKMNPIIGRQEEAFAAKTNDNNLVGFGQIRPLDESHAELSSVYVEQEFRRQGVATRLISALIERHQAANPSKKLCLLTLESTTALYEQFDFVRVKNKDLNGLPPMLLFEFILGRIISAALGNNLVCMPRVILNSTLSTVMYLVLDRSVYEDHAFAYRFDGNKREVGQTCGCRTTQHHSTKLHVLSERKPSPYQREESLEAIASKVYTSEEQIMKSSTSESPRSVTGRSPRIKFTPSPLVLKDDIELSRAEQIATMKEYAMYQRIMSSRPSNADAFPAPLSGWCKTNSAHENDEEDGDNGTGTKVEDTRYSSNFVDLDGIFELDL